LQSTSTNVLSSLADNTAVKLLGLFSSEKAKAPSPPLIISVDDTPSRTDVFPSVDCSPGDAEVEVVHIRGVTKCRKRGRTRGKANSDSSDVTSGRRSSPESGYRSVADGASSTPVVSSDLSHDSLPSVSSCSSSTVTSPVADGSSSVSTKSSDVPLGVFSRPVEFLAETSSSIITRTEAEDELIRSILEDHCKSLCHSVISDDASSTSLPVAKSVSTNAGVPTLNIDVYETSQPAGQCMEETTYGTSGGIGRQEEEDSGKSEKVVSVSVDEPVSSAVDDEFSIYDDSRLAVQHCSVRTTPDESVVTFDDTSVDSTQPPFRFDPLSLLSLAEADGTASDTRLSRTSSMSSALSLDSFAHSAEVR